MFLCFDVFLMLINVQTGFCTLCKTLSNASRKDANMLDTGRFPHLKRVIQTDSFVTDSPQKLLLADLRIQI